MNVIAVKELRERMREIKINRSEFVREAMRKKVEREERRKAVETLLRDLRNKRCSVPRGFINRTIREVREARRAST